MIKKVILFIVLFFCNFVLSQKQITEKLYNTEYYNDCNEVSINIGKAIFIVVYINNGHPNDSLIAVREFKELKKNFKSANFYFLQKNGKIKINNQSKTVLNFDEVNENHQKIIFWDGKKESDVVEYENIVNGTEFFSEALNQNGTSSYIENYNKTKDSIFELMAWKPNENSKKLSDKYMKNKILEHFNVFDDFSEFLNFDVKGVKRLVVNSNMKGYKNPWIEMWFNENGLPTKSIVTSDDSDHKKGQIDFEYTDGLISKTTVKYQYDDEEYEHSSEIYYSNNYLIVSEHERVVFYYLNSDFLNFKSYYFNSSNFDFLIDTYKLTNTNQIEYKEFGGMNNSIIKFNKKDDFYPVVYTIRPEEDEHNKYVATLTKVSDLDYKVSSKNVAFLKINYLTKNLIKEVFIIDPDDISKDKKINQNKFDFNYEYFK